jgi:hypothetical protein
VAGDGSREPPNDLGALVGVLTEERDDEEGQTTTPSASGGYGGDTLEVTAYTKIKRCREPWRRHPKGGLR